MELKCYFKILVSPSFVKNHSILFRTCWQQWFISYFQDHALASKNKKKNFFFGWQGVGVAKIKIIHCQGKEARKSFFFEENLGKKEKRSRMLSKLLVSSLNFFFFFYISAVLFFSCWGLRATSHPTYAQISLFLAPYSSNDKHSPNNIYWTFTTLPEKEGKKSKLFRSPSHRTADPWYFQRGVSKTLANS